MLNFTVGPVQSDDDIRRIGAEQVPYFRTAEFSKTMLENEQMIKEIAGAAERSRAVFLTGSGTAAMEAAVMNLLGPDDKALVVNGGSFGQRFAELCEIHGIQYDQITIDSGCSLKKEHLLPYEGSSYTAFLVNLHETSTGVLYNLELISEFCKKNNLLLIVDAISAFLADPIHMESAGIDALLIGSQKALACPPGVSIVVLSEKAIDRVERNDVRCMYLNLKSALSNGIRGQTPFTPAVGILRQLHARLQTICQNGGSLTEVKKTEALARDFRNRISKLPFEIVSETMSNAVTPLHPLNVSAYQVFLTLKDEYGIWVCPNGGALRDTVFRVGHIGNLTLQDNDVLIAALSDMNARGLL